MLVNVFSGCLGFGPVSDFFRHHLTDLCISMETTTVLNKYVYSRFSAENALHRLWGSLICMVKRQFFLQWPFFIRYGDAKVNRNTTIFERTFPEQATMAWSLTFAQVRHGFLRQGGGKRFCIALAAGWLAGFHSWLIQRNSCKYIVYFQSFVGNWSGSPASASSSSEWSEGNGNGMHSPRSAMLARLHSNSSSQKLISSSSSNPNQMYQYITANSHSLHSQDPRPMYLWIEVP